MKKTLAIKTCPANDLVAYNEFSTKKSSYSFNWKTVETSEVTKYDKNTLKFTLRENDYVSPGKCCQNVQKN